MMALKENIYLIILFLSLNIFLYILKNNFYSKFLPIDKPHGRKIHINPVVINGGFIFFVNIIIFLIVTKFQYKIFENFNDDKIIFIFFLTIIFFLGLLDDKINLNGSLKLILLIALIYFFLINYKIFWITELKFSFSTKSINLGWFSIYFTILCISLFINSFNMFD